MEVEMNTNAQLIRKLREDRAWSQEHLAAVAGVSARTIQRVEAEGSASRETRMAIAAALDIELSQLNQVAGIEAATVAPVAVTADAPTPAPSPSQSGLAERVLWRFAIVVMVVIAFGYTLGKDLALSDSRAACAADPTHCGR